MDRTATQNQDSVDRGSREVMAGNADLIAYYQNTHAKRAYGTSSVKQLRMLRPWVSVADPASVIDYGCGQSAFLDLLGLPESVQQVRYDPGVPAFSTLPTQTFDLLTNIDVLEHVEETDLDTVLAEMRALCRRAIIVIDTRRAHHTLPDGRNAHVTLRSHAWWQDRLASHFPHVDPIATVRSTRAGFKTWASSPAEMSLYYAQRAKEAAAYYAKRLIGRHKPTWRMPL